MPAKSWKDLMNDAEKGSKEFEILAEAPYSFVIKEAAKVGETSKGNPMFTVRATVESGPRANAIVTHRFIVSDSPYAMKTFFFGDLAILGLGSAFFETNPTEEQIAKELLGKRFTADVFHEKGTDDKDYARLRNFSAPTSAAPAAGAGVPAGLPTAAPVGIPVATQQVASPGIESPWGNAPAAPVAPAPQTNAAPPMPPAFG